MKRKNYEKPTMNVVKLQHTQMLMTSVVGAQRSSYGAANVQTWGGDAGVKANRNTNLWDDDWSKQ